MVQKKRDIPDIFADGGRVEDWTEGRRNQVLRLFEEIEFGTMPKRGFCINYQKISERQVLQGKATCSLLNMEFKVGNDSYNVSFTLLIPSGDTEKHPVNLFIYPYENNAPGYPMERIELQSEFDNPYWPAEMMIDRGYAAAAFYVKEVESDHAECFPSGLVKFFDNHSETKGCTGRCIAAWAFAARNIVSFLFTHPQICKEEITITGHSRGGKTALWCGALDERIACTFANCSGCGGASLARGTRGETIGQITKAFPHWFCGKYAEYAGKEDELPFDQHMLLGLCAPRLLYITSGSEDSWNDPEGEFLSCVYAGKFWKQYGLMGIETEQMPLPGEMLHRGSIGYHIRKGGHDLTRFDWSCFLDYFDKHRKKG